MLIKRCGVVLSEPHGGGGHLLLGSGSLQGNCCSKKYISVYFKNSFVPKQKFHCEKYNALTSLPVLNLTFNIYTNILQLQSLKIV